MIVLFNNEGIKNKNKIIRNEIYIIPGGATLFFEIELLDYVYIWLYIIFELLLKYYYFEK